MSKLLSVQGLATLGILIMLMASSFFASMQYRGHKDTVLERSRLAEILESATDRQEEFTLSLLNVFEGYVKKSFSGEASTNPTGWSENNPTFGQCATAALIVEYFFGGEILEAEIPEKWYDATWFSTHYWNRIGEQNIDLAREQFPSNFPYDDLVNGRLGRVRIITREDMLSDKDTAENFNKTMKKLEKILF